MAHSSDKSSQKELDCSTPPYPQLNSALRRTAGSADMVGSHRGMSVTQVDPSWVKLCHRRPAMGTWDTGDYQSGSDLQMDDDGGKIGWRLVSSRGWLRRRRATEAAAGPGTIPAQSGGMFAELMPDETRHAQFNSIGESDMRVTVMVTPWPTVTSSRQNNIQLARGCALLCLLNWYQCELKSTGSVQQEQE
ncbi:hypothetical protein DPEC_G00269680 [Dallia pectoralis]|uniref:Uncharacterized protein n=1 Tax=Dallia pectoralis TaxID=75939 RepID=A0ACC2FP12_DALPE|nr:hypothetical protein DPEC_G00269680 [Dallia pectoralis]